jgi:hypothetical protein
MWTRPAESNAYFKAGVKYTYASVGLILNKLQEPFALDGVPFEKK